MSRTQDKRIGDSTTIQFKERFVHFLTGEEVKADELTIKFINRCLKNRELSSVAMSFFYDYAHGDIHSSGKDDSKDLRRIEKMLREIDRKLSSGIVVTQTGESIEEQEEVVEEEFEGLDDDILSEQFGLPD